MPASDFNEFVTRKTQAEKAPAVDWAQRRQEWLQDVQNLYDIILDFLADYINDGRIAVSHEPVVIKEDRLGSYETHRLVLRIGDDTIDFVPIGAVIFGAWGRVDLVGPKGRARLVLVDRAAQTARVKVTIVDPREVQQPYVRPPREEWSWKIAAAPPAMTLTDLTPETLQDAILEVANA